MQKTANKALHSGCQKRRGFRYATAPHFWQPVILIVMFTECSTQISLFYPSRRSYDVAMNTEAKRILDNAMHLPVLDRAAVAEKLLASLDAPDSAIDKLWAEEAEARIDAYERSEMETVLAEDVFGKYEKR